MKSKKLKKNKKIQKSKKRKGGAAANNLSVGELSQSYNDVCRTPRCVSCRYFAMKAYFLKIGYQLTDMDGLFKKYDRGALNSLATPFILSKLKSLPNFLPIFITAKGEPISSPLHVFIIRRKPVVKVGSKRKKNDTVYVVDGSWGQSRAAKEEEWLTYVEIQKTKNESYSNWDEFDVDEIAHQPTTQRYFSEEELKEMLSQLDNPKNLQKLFGLTDAELGCVNIHELENVDLYMFNPTLEQIDEA